MRRTNTAKWLENYNRWQIKVQKKRRAAHLHLFDPWPYRAASVQRQSGRLAR